MFELEKASPNTIFSPLRCVLNDELNLIVRVRSQHQTPARLEPSQGCKPRSIQLQTLQQEINLHLLAMEKAPSPKKAQGASTDRKSKPEIPARKDSRIFSESAAVTNPRRGCLHPTRCLTHRMGFKTPPHCQTICTFSKQDLNSSSATDKIQTSF